MNLDFVLLSDRPQAVPTVAGWWFDAWGHQEPGKSPELIARDLAQQLDPRELPIQVLAELDGVAVGVAVLKLHEMEDVFPHRENWLGSVFVAHQARGLGVASALVQQIEDLAACRGVERLHLQTEQLDGGLYAARGWRPWRRLEYRGYQALVMTKRLDRAAEQPICVTRMMPTDP